MKKKNVVILQTIALILQVVVLTMMILVTVFQAPLKELTNMGGDTSGVFAFPIDYCLQIILQLVLCAVAWWIFREAGPDAAVAKVVMLLVIWYLGGLLISGSSTLISSLISMQGVDALISYVALNSMLALIVTPVQRIASMLFFVTCGAYVSCKEDITPKI